MNKRKSLSIVTFISNYADRSFFSQIPVNIPYHAGIDDSEPKRCRYRLGLESMLACYGMFTGILFSLLQFKVVHVREKIWICGLNAPS